MADWPVLSLREAGVTLIDCEHRTPEAAPSGYPYVAILQMKEGRLDFASARKISERDFRDWTRKARPRQHDVVLSRRTNPGVIAAVGGEADFALGQNLVLLRADGRHVSPPFLRWLAQGPLWWQQVKRHLNVGAVFDSLRCADIPRFTLPIPPLSAQAQIASLLGALDDKIALNGQMNSTLEAMARAVFDDWFVRFGPVRAKAEGRAPPDLAPDLAAIFPDRLTETPAGKSPEGWSIVPLSRLTLVARGLSYNGAGLNDHGRPLHNLNSIFEGGGYKRDGIKRYSGPHAGRHVLEAGDIIVANTEQGHERRLIGYAAIVPACFGRDGLFSQHIYRVRPSQASHVSSHWLCHLLNSDACHTVVSGYANGSTVNMLPLDALQKPSFVVPPPTIIQAFDRIARPVHERQQHNLDESETLAALRDLLLPRLISGQLHLREAERAVEAAL